MPTKKIWIFAIIFGLLMSFLFLMLTLNQEGTNTATPDEAAVEETTETENSQGRLNIENGKRAMTISVDQIQNVAGAVEPESRVDVVSVFEEGTAQILLENVKVLAVGNRVGAPDENEDESYETVTLEVTATQGATLALAREYAFITLMLRTEEDTETTEEKNISLDQLRKVEVLNGP